MEAKIAKIVLLEIGLTFLKTCILWQHWYGISHFPAPSICQHTHPHHGRQCGVLPAGSRCVFLFSPRDGNQERLLHGAANGSGGLGKRD